MKSIPEGWHSAKGEGVAGGEREREIHEVTAHEKFGETDCLHYQNKYPSVCTSTTYNKCIFGFIINYVIYRVNSRKLLP